MERNALLVLDQMATGSGCHPVIDNLSEGKKGGIKMSVQKKAYELNFLKYIFLVLAILAFPGSIALQTDGAIPIPVIENLAEIPRQELWREFEQVTRSEVVNSEEFFSLAQNSWSQSFLRVNGTLELRVGGSDGPLISWKDRGAGGRYTWRPEDAAETRDISAWVGRGPRIRLWARFTPSGNDPCLMDTLAGGNRRQRWVFNGVAEFEIGQ